MRTPFILATPCGLMLCGLLGCGSSTTAAEPVEPIEVAHLEAEEEPAPGESPQAPREPEPSSGPMSIEAPSDVGGVPPDAEVTPSGLASRVLRSGTGTDHPAASDEVTVHYVGWTTDGERFDSSIERGTPATFPLDGVIAGWTEGLQLMVEGERRRLWIPQDLAYGGRPGKPQGMLVFDVELIEIGR